MLCSKTIYLVSNLSVADLIKMQEAQNNLKIILLLKFKFTPKLCENFFAYSCMSEHSKHILVADRGLTPPPPLADKSNRFVFYGDFS